MKTKLLTFLFICGSFFLAQNIQAQDFSFKFMSPFFGGDTFNFQQILSSAEAQNTYTAPATEQDMSRYNPYGTSGSELSDFEASLNRQILSQLSRRLVSDQFGDEDLQPGTYVIGNFQIDITEENGGINVIIFDLDSGDQSTIFVPYF